MFVWTFDLRTLFFIALLLPLAGAFFALRIDRWQRRRHGTAAQVDLLATWFATAPVGLLLFDEAGTFLQSNQMARQLLELPAPYDVLPEHPWTRLLREDLHEAGRLRTVEVLPDAGADDERSHILRWWITCQQTLTLVLLLDITEQQRAAGAANRLLSDLSHELRTPLATLLTHLEVLSLPALSDEVRSQSIAFMKDETQRLVRMSNRTLELGQLQTGAALEPKGVALRLLAESVVAQMQIEAAAQDTYITIEADEPLPLVAGDPDGLRQVLLNLLDNAVKYGVAHSEGEGRPNRIAVELRRAPGGLACAIRDRGPGIASEHLPHLERRFYRAAPSHVAGSGLGLAMVREILRRHNSHLEITSHTGGETRGTTVRFVLPLYRGNADEGGS